MTDGDPMAPRGPNYAAWGLALIILPMGASLIAQWTSMREGREIAAARDVRQDAEIEALKKDARTRENDRSSERQFSEFQLVVVGRLTAIEEQLKALQERRR